MRCCRLWFSSVSRYMVFLFSSEESSDFFKAVQETWRVLFNTAQCHESVLLFRVFLGKLGKIYGFENKMWKFWLLVGKKYKQHLTFFFPVFYPFYYWLNYLKQQYFDCWMRIERKKRKVFVLSFCSHSIWLPSGIGGAQINSSLFRWGLSTCSSLRRTAIQTNEPTKINPS